MRGLRNSAAPDDRAPVLLLRSFTDDRVRMRARLLDRANLIDQLALRRWESFEEVEAAALSRYGPVFAVATQERFSPALGAVRMQFSHEEWQVGVGELVEKSVMIAVTVGRSRWACVGVGSDPRRWPPAQDDLPDPSGQGFRTPGAVVGPSRGYGHTLGVLRHRWYRANSAGRVLAAWQRGAIGCHGGRA